MRKYITKAFSHVLNNSLLSIIPTFDSVGLCLTELKKASLQNVGNKQLKKNVCYWLKNECKEICPNISPWQHINKFGHNMSSKQQQKYCEK
jgi:hypothetical protein